MPAVLSAHSPLAHWGQGNVTAHLRSHDKVTNYRHNKPKDNSPLSPGRQQHLQRPQAHSSMPELPAARLIPKSSASVASCTSLLGWIVT